MLLAKTSYFNVKIGEESAYATVFQWLTQVQQWKKNKKQQLKTKGEIILEKQNVKQLLKNKRRTIEIKNKNNEGKKAWNKK